jgi:glycosyltransferase involved in cell wall biosynthesis
VIPAYGVEAYLDICLESVVSQTLERLEVIVVDDGSLDRSGAIADVWAARYPNRIKVIHKPNGGCASARMAGLYAAEGLYVGFVDGDDWVAPTMYEELYRGAATEAAEISQCGFYEAFNDGTKVMHPTAFAGAGLGGTTGVVRKPEELLGLQPSVWRRIFRRDFLLTRRIEFPSHIKRFDDLPFAFLSLAQAQRVAIIPDCFYAYRQGRLGQDIESRDERLYIHFDIFDWLYKRIMPWATQSILQQFNQVEFGTHMWALDRIERRLVPEYRNRAIAQMKQHAAPAKMMMKLQKSRSKA